MCSVNSERLPTLEIRWTPCPEKFFRPSRDLTTLVFSEIGQDGTPIPKQQSRSQSVPKNNAMITKNGLLRPSVRNITTTAPTPKPLAKTEPDETDIDFSNIPTIQGTYKATKIIETTDKPSSQVSSERKKEIASTRAPEISTVTNPPEKIERTSLKPREPSTTMKVPYKDFVDPEFETSPWKPMVPSFVNPDLDPFKTGSKIADEASLTAFDKENRVSSPGLTRPDIFQPEEPPVPVERPVLFNDNDRIGPQEMVNFRVNGKFKNKIPTGVVIGGEPLFRDDVNFGEIEVEDGTIPGPKTYNVHLSSEPSTTSSVNLDDGFTGLPAIAGIGEAEVVLDESELEGRNRFSDIEALPDVQGPEDTMQDRKATWELPLLRREPVYTSYSSPDLNGEAKPSLVENPGTLRPFRHTIPVDKIAGIVETGSDLISTTEDDREVVTEVEKLSKIELAEGPEPIEPSFPVSVIDDEKTLKHTTTEFYAEMLHPANNNGEKLTAAEDQVRIKESVPSRRNSTFVEVDTVKHIPGNYSDPGEDAPGEEESVLKIYNDTLKANVVKNLVTLAPVISNSGIRRPIRPRPNLGLDKDDESVEKEENENGEVRKFEDSPIEEIVEVITSISTKVSSNDDRIFSKEARPVPVVVHDSKIPGNSDRKISSAEESTMLLEKLKQFANVQTDTVSVIKKRDDSIPVRIDNNRPEVDEDIQKLANIKELSKLATISTGDLVNIRNDTSDFSLSRDGVQILTKILNKAEERTEKMRSSTEGNEKSKNLGNFTIIISCSSS